MIDRALLDEQLLAFADRYEADCAVLREIGMSPEEMRPHEVLTAADFVRLVRQPESD